MMAGLFVMGMYWEQIRVFKEEMLAAHQPLVSPAGPASILVSFPGPSQSLGYLFL